MSKLKILIFVFLILTIEKSTYCQKWNDGQRLLIYSNKNDFLIPYVQSVLTDLQLYSGSEHYFSKVTNLNLLLLNTKADKAVRESLNLYFPNVNFSNNHISDSVLKIFTQNDLFLLINENTLQDKIEFQFTLYEILNDKIVERSLNEYPLRNIIKPSNSKIDFFIDVTQKDYLTILKNKIKQLFPTTNFLTKFNPVLDGNFASISNDSFKVAKNDTLGLNILDIYDEDTPIDQINFNIQIRELNNNNETFYLTGKGSHFKMLFKNTGEYAVIVNANDGSEIPNLKQLFIKVLNIPKLVVLENNFTFHVPPKGNIIGSHHYYYTIKVPVYLLNDSTNKIDFRLSTDKSFANSDQNTLDSIMREYKMIKYYDFKYPDIQAGNDSFTIKKIDKVNRHLYLLTVNTHTNQRISSFYIYGIQNNLKTNSQLINIKAIYNRIAILETGLSQDFLKIENLKNDNIETVNYTQFYPFEIQFAGITYKSISVGASFKYSLVLSKNINFDKNPILRDFNNTIGFGYFIQSKINSPSVSYVLQFGYNIENTFNGFDTTLRELSGYNLVLSGFYFNTSIFFLKHSNLGFSFRVENVDDRFKYLRFKKLGFNIGVRFNLGTDNFY